MKQSPFISFLLGSVWLPCLATLGCMHQAPPPLDYDQVGSIEAPQTVTHTVGRGETLMSISRKYTGTPKNWKKIASANNINPNKLRAGDTVLIPSSLMSAAPTRSNRSDNRMAMLSDSDILPSAKTKAKSLPAAATPKDGKAQTEARAAGTKKVPEQAARAGDLKVAKDTKANASSRVARAAQPQQRSRQELAREVVIFDPTPEEHLEDTQTAAASTKSPRATTAQAPDLQRPTSLSSAPRPSVLAKKDESSAPVEKAAQARDKVKAVETAAASVDESTHHRESRAMLDSSSGSAAKPARSKTSTEAPAAATVEKPAVFRKAGQKKDVQQNARSNFYSCVADKCSYHTF